MTDTRDIDAEACPDCGGDCAPECGRHPAGCTYGGFTEATGYWLVVDGCGRDHSGGLPPIGVVIFNDEDQNAPRTEGT